MHRSACVSLALLLAAPGCMCMPGHQVDEFRPVVFEDPATGRKYMASGVARIPERQVHFTNGPTVTAPAYNCIRDEITGRTFSPRGYRATYISPDAYREALRTGVIP